MAESTIDYAFYVHTYTLFLSIFHHLAFEDLVRSLRMASIIISDFCPSNLVSLFKHTVEKKPTFFEYSLFVWRIYENHMSISCQSSWISVIKTLCTMGWHLIPFEDKHFCGSLSLVFFMTLSTGAHSEKPSEWLSIRAPSFLPSQFSE